MTSDFQVGRWVDQAASDFTKWAYVVKYLIRVGTQVGQKYPKRHPTLYVNAPKGLTKLAILPNCKRPEMLCLALLPCREVPKLVKSTKLAVSNNIFIIAPVHSQTKEEQSVGTTQWVIR